MSPEPRADAPQRWLNNARADLALAGVPLPPGGLYEHLCFHAHQAAEKSLKAVLLHARVSFPFTHNLQVLLDLLPANLDAPPDLDALVDLNPYAVTTRYPGEMEPVTENEYWDALRLATTAVSWVEGIVEPSSGISDRDA